MKLTFEGAAREVTGSCHLLEVGGQKILIDCGMEQGGDAKDGAGLPFAARMIDCVIVTHAHIDHSGRIPLLVKNGFSGRIIATRATCNLMRIMLKDSAHIQESEAEWENRKGKRAGRAPVEPLYDMQDAEDAIRLFSSCGYGEVVDVLSGVRARFTDAGHLLGSASVEVWIQESSTQKKLAFSGDIGNINQPIISDPKYITEADFVIMESTYGDREHEAAEAGHISVLAGIIERTLSRGGNVIIPAFAVGRTQELLYFIREIKQKGLVKSNPGFPVYVDSPLAAEAIKVFEENLQSYVDEETVAVIKSGSDPLKFENLRITASADESKALNLDMTPKVIISSSGMCEAGRIRHHLKHNLWRDESTVVFAGYQANGTLGRIILDGAKKVKLFGEDIEIKAEIVNFRGLSGHADRSGLLKWLDAFEPKPGFVFLVHGETEVCELLAGELRAKGYSAEAPLWQASYDLVEETWISEGITPPEKDLGAGRRPSPAFARLLAAGSRMTALIDQKKGGSNKDLAKLADQLEALMTKWEK